MSLFDSIRGLFGRGTGNGDVAAIGCEDALRRVQEFLDGELDGVSAAEVEAHFEACRRCYPHLRLERNFRAAVRRAAGQESAPTELKERLVELIVQAGPEG